MPDIEFLTYSDGAGANVMTQAAYASNPAQQVGVNDGIADPTLYNKAQRQSAHVTAAIANYMGNIIAADILDDGNLLEFWSQFWRALLGSGYFIDSGVASAMLVAAPFGLTFPAPIAGLRISIKAAATATGPVTLNWMGTGNKNVLYGDGSQIQPGDIEIGTIAELCYDGTQWQCVSVPRGAILLRLGTAIIYQVNEATGSDTTGAGTIASPWATIQHAVNFVQQQVNLAGQTVDINTAGGTYAAGASLGAPLLGQASPGSLVFTTSGGGVTINGAGTCFSANGGASYTINGSFYFNQTNVSGSPNGAISVTNGARIVLDTGSTFGPAQGGHLAAASGGEIAIAGDYTIDGGALTHWNAFQGGSITVEVANVVTINPTPAFSTAFASAGSCAVINALLTSFSGSATGSLYNISTNGVIAAGGVVFPGNVGGTINSGGQLV